MDKNREHAYRYLLYWAMIEIRTVDAMFWGTFRRWNPFYWRREARRIRFAAALADWLHNLARYSSWNFRQFDEDWFWRDFESLKSRYPEFGPERYRDLFNERLDAYWRSEIPEVRAITDPRDV